MPPQPIIAGTAAETAVEVTLTTILKRDHLGPVGEVARDSIRSPNLKDYLKHVERRNEVVYSGRIERQSVTSADAEESVGVARQVLYHVTQVVRASES